MTIKEGLATGPELIKIVKHFIKSEHAQNLLYEHNAEYKKVVVLQLSIS